MKLVIVESPTKAKTIEKFLGKEYKVLSSYGHIRDLPKSKLGVDVENNFEPQYVIPRKASPRVTELRKELKKCDGAILATDEDREGEAIAFHLMEALKLKDPDRIVFHEITKTAIEEALGNPRKLDENLVNSQQARRILDRLVGYKLSPLLWKKIIRGLSAGRVQSVVVRLIVERENEIKAFKPEEYWTMSGLFENEINANLLKINNKSLDKLEIKNKEQFEEIKKDAEGLKYDLDSITKKERIRKTPTPFTTSTLQQTASKRLGMSAKATMMTAQKLYEKGLITYHRTDSLNLSSQSISDAEKYITDTLGKEFHKERHFKTKSKGAQEAHEAIRPTSVFKTPENTKIDARHIKLYNLIWTRFLASQMTEAVFDSVAIDIISDNKRYLFRATGQTLKFPGFLKIYSMKFEENEIKNPKEGPIELIKIEGLQHFTEPPARYNEAGLIKILEKEGIGRPSTYAPIIDTIQKRGYAEKNEQKRFQPTEIGETVNTLLVDHFPQIVDLKFTAGMENNLDKIAEGNANWRVTLKEFYDPFSKTLEEKMENIEKKDMTEKTDKKCPKCQSDVIIRTGRFGKFYACSNFPECKHTENIQKESLNINCPKCEKGKMVEKRTKSRKTFYGCDKYPECDNAVWDKPTGELCPKCNSLLVEKYKKIMCSNKDCKFKKD